MFETLIKKRDFYAGGIMILLGAGITLNSTTYNTGTLMHMGPGMFPFILGVTLTFVGLMIFGTAVVTPLGDDETILPRANPLLLGHAAAERHLAEAFAGGQLRSADLKRVQIAGRALVYGFARMNIDGHFPRWGVAGDDVETTAEAILDLFIDGIAARPRPGS